MPARMGRIAPLQIHSQDLAGVAAHRVGSGMAAFSAFPQDQTAATRKPGHWRERDLRRALQVARRAGIGNYRVEIAPDGTISIVVLAGKAGARR